MAYCALLDFKTIAKRIYIHEDTVPCVHENRVYLITQYMNIFLNYVGGKLRLLDYKFLLFTNFLNHVFCVYATQLIFFT